jgi:hypothetical protein
MAENEDIEKVEDESEKKSLFANKKLLLIIAIVLLVLIVAAATFFLLGSSDDETTSEELETSEVEETDANQQALDIPEGDLPDDLPEEEQTDEDVELVLPEFPEDTPPEQPQSAQSRLEQISGSMRKPSSENSDDVAASGSSQSEQDQSAIELAEEVEMPDNPADNNEQQAINPEVIAIINEFITAEKLAEEIFKLRRRAELHNKETTRIYQQLGDLEDKLREKDRIIRAQDTAYTKGPKVSPTSRNSGPIKPPEPSWDISPTHTGP